MSSSKPVRQRKLEPWSLPIGAEVTSRGTRFRVWAPKPKRVEVVMLDKEGRQTGIESLGLERPDDNGDQYYSREIPGIEAGQRYKYRLDGDGFFPDPASRYQPEGPEGPSEIVNPHFFGWTDEEWEGVALEELVLYEVHVGTATREGTFDALTSCLGHIANLGVTAILLMPVAEFAGERNWGYDGVNLFAPSHNYGGPAALRRFIDAAHRHKVGVIIDVVFNHLGNDGNFLSEFTPTYFNPKHDTGWGPALNIEDRRDNHPVRDFLINNSRYWASEFHADGLRLDAIHAFPREVEPRMMEDIKKGVIEILPPSRKFLVVAEDDLMDLKLLDSRKSNLDALYSDDFHHQLYVALTGLTHGYYEDFTGSAEDLAQTMERSCWFDGTKESTWRKRRGVKQMPGGSTDAVPCTSFIWSIENHDQVGNRPFGQRFSKILQEELGESAGSAACRMSTAILLLSPHTPLLFMGQEWAASTPFLYFCNVGDWLIESVREGRQRDYKEQFDVEIGVTPDIRDLKTFNDCKLVWQERRRDPHAKTLQFCKDLLELRKLLKISKYSKRDSFAVRAHGPDTLFLEWKDANGNLEMLGVANLRGKRQFFPKDYLKAPGWDILLDTGAPTPSSNEESCFTGDQVRFDGAGFVLFGAPRRDNPTKSRVHSIWCGYTIPQKDDEPLNKDYKYDVFLSYSSKDKSAVDQLYEESKKAGFRPFQSAVDLAPGDVWESKLEEAMSNSHRFAVLLSRYSLKSSWVQFEFGFARALAKAHKKATIPILVDLDVKELQKSPYKSFQTIQLADILSALKEK